MPEEEDKELLGKQIKSGMKGIDNVIKTIKGMSMNKKTEKEFDEKWENGDFLVNRHDFEPETSPDAIKAYINEHFIDKEDVSLVRTGDKLQGGLKCGETYSTTDENHCTKSPQGIHQFMQDVQGKESIFVICALCGEKRHINTKDGKVTILNK